jgi:hypothetical protein
LKFELQILMLMVMVGLGIKKPDWKLWVVIGLLVFAWMMVNWLILDKKVAGAK